MRSAIISAQRTSDEIIRNAHEQADNIVKDAKVRAQELLNDMDGRIQALNRECAEIEGRSSLLRAKLRTVLNTFVQMLDELPEEKEHTKRIEKVKHEQNQEETKKVTEQ